MTPEEFRDKMRAIFAEDKDSYPDLEASHANADGLMCELLRQLGYGEGVEIFEKADKWYA